MPDINKRTIRDKLLGSDDVIHIAPSCSDDLNYFVKKDGTRIRIIETKEGKTILDIDYNWRGIKDPIAFHIYKIARGIYIIGFIGINNKLESQLLTKDTGSIYKLLDRIVESNPDRSYSWDEAEGFEAGLGDNREKVINGMFDVIFMQKTNTMPKEISQFHAKENLLLVDTIEKYTERFSLSRICCERQLINRVSGEVLYTFKIGEEARNRNQVWPGIHWTKEGIVVIPALCYTNFARQPLNIYDYNRTLIIGWDGTIIRDGDAKISYMDGTTEVAMHMWYIDVPEKHAKIEWLQ
jgi:hypothetical protein